MFKHGRLAELRKEANELLSIVIASRKTSKSPDHTEEKTSLISIANRQSKIGNNSA